MTASQQASKSIVFLHPDLGIGGAERLVIDAAVGLQSLGHKVTVFTSHCDPSHCFDEARDGTLDVRVRGNSLIPPTILGRFAILCAILRQLHLVLSIVVFSSELADLCPTEFFVDQLSACVPILRLVSDARILFYCHFPDKLLAQKGVGALAVVKGFYRIPFNWLEAWSTSCSDGIVVNSKFTAGVVKGAFPTLKTRTLKVVYPCVDTSAVENETKENARSKTLLWPDKRILLSINRFERKKDVALAIKAFAGIDENDRKDARLVIAGGYDPRMAENVSYHKDLQSLADSFGITHATFRKLESASDVSDGIQCLFLLSVPDTLKQSLLDSASLLIYTPKNEHFGIVPLEAMLNSVPVLAANQGGPLETVVDGQTGWLRNVADVPAWTEVMQHVLDQQKSSQSALAKVGEAGRSRVLSGFSKRQMALRLDESFKDMNEAQRAPIADDLMVPLTLATVFVVGLGIFLMYVLHSGRFWRGTMYRDIERS